MIVGRGGWVRQIAGMNGMKIMKILGSVCKEAGMYLLHSFGKP
jgi:hypothetical protein